MSPEDIKLEGRMDFAKGLGFHQNPYYRHVRMPSTTGESFLLWHEKIYAWEAGWSEAESERQALQKRPIAIQESSLAKRW